MEWREDPREPRRTVLVDGVRMVRAHVYRLNVSGGGLVREVAVRNTELVRFGAGSLWSVAQEHHARRE